MSLPSMFNVDRGIDDLISWGGGRVGETAKKIAQSNQGPVVQSPIGTNPELTLNKTYEVNPGLALIGL